jgi:hypothetical protein
MIVRWAMLALAASTVIASAAEPKREWYVLNFNTGKCERAKERLSAIGTPDAFHHAIRDSGETDNVKVVKGETGEVEYVTISIPHNGGEVSLYWFPNKNNCEVMRVVKQDEGAIPNSDDMK